MKHHTVKHAHHTVHTTRGGQRPGEHFKAIEGAGSGKLKPVTGHVHGSEMPSTMPEENMIPGFRHGGRVKR
jgi:hypothetical protein